MDGLRLRDEIVDGLRATIEAAGSPPVCLATVLVGDDAPSQRYVKMKHEQAAQAGHDQPPRDAPRGRPPGGGRGASCATLAEDPAVHGILVQLPLPAGLDEDAVLSLIPAEKDVDGLTDGVARPPGARSARAGRVHPARGDAPARALRRGHERAGEPW